MTVIGISITAIDAIVVVIDCGTGYGHAVVIGLCGSILTAIGMSITAIDGAIDVVAIDGGIGYSHAVAVGSCSSGLTAIAFDMSFAAIDAFGCRFIRYGYAVVIGLCRSGLIAIAFDISFAAIDVTDLGLGTGYVHAIVIGLCGGVFTVRRILVLAFTLIVQCTCTGLVFV